MAHLNPWTSSLNPRCTILFVWLLSTFLRSGSPIELNVFVGATQYLCYLPFSPSVRSYSDECLVLSNAMPLSSDRKSCLKACILPPFGWSGIYSIHGYMLFHAHDWCKKTEIIFMRIVTAYAFCHDRHGCVLLVHSFCIIWAFLLLFAIFSVVGPFVVQTRRSISQQTCMTTPSMKQRLNQAYYTLMYCQPTIFWQANYSSLMHYNRS